MKDDIFTIVWKELSEVRAGPRGKGLRSTAPLVILMLFVSVAIPFSAGSAQFGGVAVTSIGMVIAATWVLTSVPDAFAGERDHRTIETLLATRLPADAILAGKLIAAVVVASVLGTVAIVLSVIASDVGTVVHGGPGDPLSVPWLDAGLGVVLVVLVAFAMANVCILVALRASSAMVAMRELGLGLAAVAIGVSSGIHALPSGARTDLTDITVDAGQLGPWVLVTLAAVVFVGLNLGLFAVTRARFTRPKLVHAG